MPENLRLDGLTLRDYLAGQVLTAAPWDYLGSDALALARQAYEIADAMLIARSEPPVAQPVSGRRAAKPSDVRPSHAERASRETPELPS